jgi:hypothetical protein
MSAMAAKSRRAAKDEVEARRRWEQEADEEQIALSRHPEFRAMLARTAAAAKRHGGLSIDEVPAFRDLTPEEEAEGERLLAELERQTEDEEAARAATGQHNVATTKGNRRARKSATRSR